MLTSTRDRMVNVPTQDASRTLTVTRFRATRGSATTTLGGRDRQAEV